VLGHEVTSFCYPRGEYLPQHVRMVADAGFRYARTVTVDYGLQAQPKALEAATTMNAYRHYSHAGKILRFAGFRPVRAATYLAWDELAIAAFDRMQREGGVYHLWGHSWEIDKFGQWSQLERVLQHIAGRSEVDYVTNGELR
jgi:hypothetical protein